MYKDTMMKKVRNIVKKRIEERKADEFMKKFSGLLPEHQIQKLDELYMPNSNINNITTNVKMPNLPHNTQNDITRQSNIRQNLITEADFKNIDIKLK